jgi:hypothetical protein
MTLHLLKLCVGVESIAELRAFTRLRRRHAAELHGQEIHAHVTRMIPKRAGELLDGGSLYWVIKGQTCARQKLVGVEPFVDSAGVKRCALQLDDEVIAVRPQPHRAFQGWRYLDPADAPPDIDASAAGLAEMPEALRRQLSDLGLI